MKRSIFAADGENEGRLAAGRRAAAFVLAALVIATLAFIWGSSMDTAGESTIKSDAARGFLTPFLELFVGAGNVTERLVRKLAHFVEFGALGGEMLLFAAARRRRGVQPVINCLSAGLFAAVADESIQLLSPGRSAQVDDVLLDFAGVLTGVLAALALCAAVRAAAGAAARRREAKLAGKG